MPWLVQWVSDAALALFNIAIALIAPSHAVCALTTALTGLSASTARYRGGPFEIARRLLFKQELIYERPASFVN